MNIPFTVLIVGQIIALCYYIKTVWAEDPNPDNEEPETCVNIFGVMMELGHSALAICITAVMIFLEYALIAWVFPKIHSLSWKVACTCGLILLVGAVSLFAFRRVKKSTGLGIKDAYFDGGTRKEEAVTALLLIEVSCFVASMLLLSLWFIHT